MVKSKSKSWQRHISLVLITICSIGIIVFFQNCGSAFESTSSSDGTSTSTGLGGGVNPPPPPVGGVDPLRNCKVAGYSLPTWQNAGEETVPTVRIGIGSNLSGNTTSRLDYTYNISKIGANAVTVACNAVRDGSTNRDGNITVNCNGSSNVGSNTGRIQVSVGNNVECVSGSATVTARLEDGCGSNSTYKTKIFKVNYTNVCPIEFVLQSASPEQQGAYGTQVALSSDGNLMVATEPLSSGSGPFKSGAAHIHYKENGQWTAATIVRPATASREMLTSVAISPNGLVIALGAPTLGQVGDYANAGVYILQRSSTSSKTWSQSKIDAPSLPFANQFAYPEFGKQVEFADNSTLLVSAPSEDHSANLVSAGAVYSYNLSGSNWSLSQRVISSSPVAFEAFGSDISAKGNSLVIAASTISGSSATNGSFYICSRSSAISCSNKVAAPSGTMSGAKFAKSVYTDGSRIVVGAPGFTNNSSNPNQGAIYIYDMTGKLLRGATRTSAATTREDFGSDVWISGNKIYASAPATTDASNTLSGAIYKFSLNTSDNSLTQNFRLVARSANRIARSQFGVNFDVQNGWVVVGAPILVTSNQNNAGKSFVIAEPQ